MKRTRLLSLPQGRLLVVLIAVTALAIGSFGTANAAGLTAKTVRKIAAKVVTKKAPGLSVAHADTATKADSATKATSATTATTANDASQLGGQSPQLYLNRLGYVSANSVGVGADTGNLLATVNITVPQGVAIIHAIGTASMPANVGELNSIWTRVDNTDCSSLSGTDYGRRTSAKGYTTLSFQYAAPTSAGAHTVSLCGTNQTTGIFATGVTLSVETVPRGYSGGGSIQ